MKKIIIIILIVITFMSISCSSNKREDIVKITYQTVDYNGGYTTNAVLNFENNEYRRNAYLPENTDFKEPELELIKTFSDEEEKEFIKGINDAGLLNIKEHYEKSGIIDGGGWTLIVEFSDGTMFKSTGSNDNPRNVFNKCSTYFYDLCDEEVMGMLPQYYKDQPNVSYTLYVFEGEKRVSGTMGLPHIKKGNYKWNKRSSFDNNYYDMNNDQEENNIFFDSYSYKLCLSTYNYDFDDRFTNITIYEYDFNKELSNEKTIYTGKWFKQIELDIELNKIYVYRLEFENGDYVEYTFNTAISTNNN